MVYETVAEGILLRVRLCPNSSCCYCGGLWINAEGKEYLKAGVTEVPEKGKANAGLIKLLSKQFNIAKSAIELTGGDTDRCKKLVLYGHSAELAVIAERLSQKEK